MTKKEIIINQMEKLLGFVGGEGRNHTPLYIVRKAVQNDLKANEKGTCGFISFIRSDQQASGPYSGLSIKVNPGNEHYRISLDIGNEGFGDDYQLASLPGIRRQYLALQRAIKTSNHNKEDKLACFCALDFADSTPKPQLRDLESRYKDDQIDSHPVDLFVAYVPAPEISENGVNENNEFWRVFKAVIASYSELRKWPSKKSERDNIVNFKSVLTDGQQAESETKTQLENVRQLLKERKYVVLQGAPGTGKTFLTSKLRQDYNQVFFTQFHAETTYSNFIGGYRPTGNQGNLNYVYQEGPLLQAIRSAQENVDQQILLVIDEINRANLSNVLGESFYLFETDSHDSRNQMTLGNPEALIRLKYLPHNLHVIATMNTADRSLAVVDFALRRRFAWYTMMPHVLDDQDLPAGQVFHQDLFLEFAGIFDMFATSEELMLEPGQAYFVTGVENADVEIANRLRYELLPLIREYLTNGQLSLAADRFNQLFIDQIDQPLFE